MFRFKAQRHVHYFAYLHSIAQPSTACKVLAVGYAIAGVILMF